MPSLSSIPRYLYVFPCSGPCISLWCVPVSIFLTFVDVVCLHFPQSRGICKFFPCSGSCISLWCVPVSIFLTFFDVVCLQFPQSRGICKFFPVLALVFLSGMFLFQYSFHLLMLYAFTFLNPEVFVLFPLF